MMRFWFAAILLVQSQIPVQQVQPGTVTGRLLSTKGTPEAGVRIAAVPVAEAGNKTGASALFGISLTDSDGRYRLDNLPPGRYYIFAGLIDLPSYYPNATSVDKATAIDVDAGVILSGIDFSMARPTSLAVAGRLAIPSTMQVGDGWIVTLSPQARAAGNSLRSNVSPDGSFEFPSVSPGEYRLAASIRGTTAMSLSVVNEDVLDMVMPVVDCDAGVAVSGRLAGTPRSAVSSISLTGSRVGCTPVVVLGPDGSFKFRNVPEGRYQIQLSPPPLGWSAMPLTVERVDLENVEVQLPAYIPVRGRANVEDGSALPRASRGPGLQIQAARSSGGETVTSSLQDDGTFELLLPRGRYRISVPGVPGGYYLKSVTSNSVDISVQPIEVGNTPPEDIEVTLGLVKRPEPSGVRVSGRLTFAPTGALPNSEGVLLVSSSGSRNAAVQESPLGPDGAFEFTGVSPGIYNIETFPDNPAALYGIVVRRSDVTGIEFTLPALVKVKGGIEWADAQGTALQSVRSNVSVQFTRKDGNRMLAWGALAQSGAFHFYLPEGDYRFSVTDIPANFDLDSVTAGDADIMEDGLRVRSDSDPPNLRVTLRPK